MPPGRLERPHPKPVAGAGDTEGVGPYEVTNIPFTFRPFSGNGSDTAGSFRRGFTAGRLWQQWQRRIRH